MEEDLLKECEGCVFEDSKCIIRHIKRHCKAHPYLDRWLYMPLFGGIVLVSVTATLMVAATFLAWLCHRWFGMLPAEWFAKGFWCTTWVCIRNIALLEVALIFLGRLWDMLSEAQRATRKWQRRMRAKR